MNRLPAVFAVFAIAFAAITALPRSLSDVPEETPDSLFEENPYFLLMGEADRAINAGNWTEAAARLIDVLAVEPDNPSNALVLYNLGACYAYMGQDSLALDAYDRSLAIAPRMLTTLLGRGHILLAMNRDYEAYESFDEAIDVDSLSTEARYYHGMMALYGGNRDIAERDFAILKSLTPHTADTAIALSTLYSLTGRDRDAIPYLKALISENPQPEYYASLAGCYLELGELSDAAATITDGMKMYPLDPELYYYRAWLNRDRFLLDDAQADGYRAVELGASPARVAALFAK